MEKKTHAEYLVLAKILGRHLGCELVSDPIDRALFLTLHFVTDPTCPLCLENAVEKAPQS